MQSESVQVHTSDQNQVIRFSKLTSIRLSLLKNLLPTEDPQRR